VIDTAPRPRAKPSATGWGGGTHVAYAGTNPQTAGESCEGTPCGTQRTHICEVPAKITKLDERHTRGYENE
jgi:hypothetical protein